MVLRPARSGPAGRREREPRPSGVGTPSAGEVAWAQRETRGFSAKPELRSAADTAWPGVVIDLDADVAVCHPGKSRPSGSADRWTTQPLWLRSARATGAPAPMARPPRPGGHPLLSRREDPAADGREHLPGASRRDRGRPPRTSNTATAVPSPSPPSHGAGNRQPRWQESRRSRRARGA
jgi:hypothetical protein